MCDHKKKAAHHAAKYTAIYDSVAFLDATRITYPAPPVDRIEQESVIMNCSHTQAQKHAIHGTVISVLEREHS